MRGASRSPLDDKAACVLSTRLDLFAQLLERQRARYFSRRYLADLRWRRLSLGLLSRLRRRRRRRWARLTLPVVLDSDASIWRQRRRRQVRKGRFQKSETQISRHTCHRC